MCAVHILQFIWPGAAATIAGYISFVSSNIQMPEPWSLTGSIRHLFNSTPGSISLRVCVCLWEMRACVYVHATSIDPISATLVFSIQIRLNNQWMVAVEALLAQEPPPPSPVCEPHSSIFIISGSSSNNKYEYSIRVSHANRVACSF